MSVPDSKFGRGLLITAIEFIRAAKNEFGDEVGEEKVYAMLDAFDKSLKGQIFMELLSDDIGLVRIRRYDNHKFNNLLAIKAIRCVTGLDLMVAKDLVDAAVNNTPVVIPGTLTVDEQRELTENLVGTGYEII